MPNLSARCSGTAIESLITNVIPSFVWLSLLSAIGVYRKNPSWTRYLIDESTELTRSLLNEVTMILGNDEETIVRVSQVIRKLERDYLRQIRALEREVKKRARAIEQIRKAVGDFRDTMAGHVKDFHSEIKDWRFGMETHEEGVTVEVSVKLLIKPKEKK